MHNRTKSAQLFEEAQKYFPGGVNSPVRAFKSVSGPPLFIKHGSGAYITDEDDNEYLDFCGSWGPLILGHNNVAIRERINKSLINGTSFGTPNRIGNEIGKLIIDNHRYIEMLRFVSSGTEAVMSALRLARGFTGKNKVVKFEGCYHGHVDSMLVKAGSGLVTLGVSSSGGVPESFAAETIVLPLNDLQGFEDLLIEKHNEIACVIIEPIPANNGLLLQDTSYLHWLRKLCDDYNVLLIFDEVISGFRVGFEGAAGLYSITPDLITFGKIIGGGMPVGAFGGRADIMKHIAPLGPVYQAGTLSANPITLNAGMAALEQLLAPEFYTTLADKTADFARIIQEHCDKMQLPVLVLHIASIFWIAFSRKRIIKADDIDPASMEYFKKMHSMLLEKGIYLGPSGYEVGFVSAAHSRDDLQKAANTICEVLDEIFGA